VEVESPYWKVYRPIPYVHVLRKLPLVDSVNACLLMGMLELDFAIEPNGFERFLIPCPSQQKLWDVSWTEMIGMSSEEFNAAFDQIGVRYDSSNMPDNSEDLFKGKYYYSITDTSKNGITTYFRNDVLADSMFRELSSVLQDKGFFREQYQEESDDYLESTDTTIIH
jgi:hypothetical protein